MIWDLHCHLSGVDGQTPDERTAQLIEYADRMGVERLVFGHSYAALTEVLGRGPEGRGECLTVQAVALLQGRAPVDG